MALSNSGIRWACQNCNIKSAKFYKLVKCSHKLCIVCFDECKQGNIFKCPLESCREKSKQSKYVSHEIKSDSSTLKELRSQYLADLNRRMKECESQTKHLKEAITKLHQDKDEHLQTINVSRDAQKEDIDKHYDSLVNDISRFIDERIRQIYGILDILAQSQRDISEELSRFYNQNTAAFEQVDNDAYRGLKKKTETSRNKTLDVVCPEPEIEIRGCTCKCGCLKKDIELSAPTPMLCKEKGQRVNFSKLNSTGLIKEKEVAISVPVQSLSVVNGQIATCEGFNGFTVYGDELKIETHFPPGGRIKSIFGMDQLSDGSLVCAAKGGLYQLDAFDGGIIFKIATSDHRSVKVFEDVVYASSIRTNIEARCEINKWVYKEGHWKAADIDKTIALPCKSNHHITLAAQPNGMITTTCVQDSRVEAFYERSGRSKWQPREQHQTARRPIVCQIDDDQNTLMCDFETSEIRIFAKNGDSKLLELDRSIREPLVAIAVNDKFFVATCHNKQFKLHQFLIRRAAWE